MWTEPTSTAAPSIVTTKLQKYANGGSDNDKLLQDSVIDLQLQQLLQINGVAAADNGSGTDNPQDNDDHGRQRSIGNGGIDGWQPQSPPPQLQLQYNRIQQQKQQSPSVSPYVPPPVPATPVMAIPQHHQQKQYYPTTTSIVPPIQNQHRHQQQQQQQQLFVTSPSSPPSPSVIQNEHHHQQSQQPQYYPQQPSFSSSVSTKNDNHGTGGSEIDADIEQQIRQQLTAVVGAGGGNYTILNSLPPSGTSSVDGINSLKQHIAGSASSDNVQYVQIGNGGTSSSRNRAQLETGGDTATGTAKRNTIVKTVVIRQKPTPQPNITTINTPASAPDSQKQSSWSIAEQQHLEQLARQVLPPGVAQYEIIRADGVNGKVDGDVAAAATTATNSASPASGTEQKLSPTTGSKKKPVTFVILEERPDGTVRVRGIEKKQHGGAGSADGGITGPVATDDEQLQQLVDKLNRGELRLPSGSVAKAGGTDNAAAASTASSFPFPAYVPSSSSSPVTSTLPPLPPLPSMPTMSNGGLFNKYHEQQQLSKYFSTIPPQTTTSAVQHHHQFQNVFLPTTVPTASSVSLATTSVSGVGQQHRYNNHHQEYQQHQPYYTPSTVAVSAASTASPINSTSSYFNKNKATKEGTFSGALRRRGFYAMAKYMRQAGVDAVLEETGMFEIFFFRNKHIKGHFLSLNKPIELKLFDLIFYKVFLQY